MAGCGSELESSLEPNVPAEKAKDDRQSEKKSWVEAEKYIQLGITLPAATVIGWFIGSLLDKWLGTHWIKIAGLFIGIAAGFVQLVRVAIASSKEQEQGPPE
jgi:F0F1-type ATP synthase assembly protein I